MRLKGDLLANLEIAISNLAAINMHLILITLPFPFGLTGKGVPSFTVIVVFHPTNLFVGKILIALRWHLAIEHLAGFRHTQLPRSLLMYSSQLAAGREKPETRSSTPGPGSSRQSF